MNVMKKKRRRRKTVVNPLEKMWTARVIVMLTTMKMKNLLIALRNLLQLLSLESARFHYFLAYCFSKFSFSFSITHFPLIKNFLFIYTDLLAKRGESSAVKGKRWCKRLATVAYAEEIFKSGYISPPKNPYFVTKMRRRRKDELYVPVDVIKDYNLDLPLEMILRDSDGREWMTKRTPWKDGRIWYYGGWANLCRVNHVQETDTCVCEFVKRKDEGKFDLQVRIVRN